MTGQKSGNEHSRDESHRDDPPLADGPDHGPLKAPLEAYRRLYEFSARLNGSVDLDELKRNLVDAVIELARAETGFLLLLGAHDRTELDVARTAAGTDLPRTEAQLSDSIVREVLERRAPVLVADAQEDTLFAESLSVVNYQLRSVVAVPIRFGDETLGVLYLGCNRRTSAFAREDLEMLGVFGAQAGLIVKNAMMVTALQRDNAALKEELESQTFGEIVGGSPMMQDIFRTVSRVAPTDITVLVTGETGTGKELIARELHRRSSRASGPFIAINMSAIPESLLEAELFGHVRGAFTGANRDRRGKFEEAHRGTLFLDEIGDMPIGLQGKLLRVLQEHTIERIGSNNPIAIDIRVVAATHQNLETLQERGAFRADLYFRLNELIVHLPPLRDRVEDIELLAAYFLSNCAARMQRPVSRFSSAATAALRRHRWRGNVRELQAKIKRAVILARDTEIDVADLDLDEEEAFVMSLREAKETFANRYVRETLNRNNGNRSKTARDLGVDPRTIYKYLEGR